MSRTWVACGLLVATMSFAAERPKLVILDLTTAGGADAQTAAAFSDALASALSGRGVFDVVSSRDVSTLLGVERQKQLLGCSESSTSCLTELSGALGARFVMSGTLAKLGDAYQLTLTTLDSQRTQPIGRSVRIAPTLKELQATLVYAACEATASPPPQPPSRVLPISVIAVGGAALVAGAVLGFQGLSQEAALQAELSNPRPGSLSTRSDYLQRAQTPATFKTASLAALIAGAVLTAGGIVWLNVQGPSSGVQVALVPGGAGAALVGSFP